MGVALKDFGIPPPSKAKAFQHRDTEHTEIFLLFVVSGVYLTRKTGVFLEHTQTPPKQEQAVATPWKLTDLHMSQPVLRPKSLTAGAVQRLGKSTNWL